MKVKAFVFVTTLGHSRRLHVRAFRAEKQEHWFAGLESAFTTFGGVPEEVLMDKRPLGVPALEDKIVQSAVAEVLCAVYEADFLGFSYGFRPGRNPHMALDALHTAIMSQRVNWVLDADIRSFLDTASYCPLVHEV